MSYAMIPLVAAGMLGRSNCGHGLPTEEQVQGAIRAVNDPRWGGTCDSGTMAEHFCQELMENDDHYKMFSDEIESWYGRFLASSTDEIQNTWPDAWALYQRAMNTMEDS